MAERNTIATAYVQLLPSMEGTEGAIADAVAPVAAKVGGSSGKDMGESILGGVSDVLGGGLGDAGERAGESLGGGILKTVTGDVTAELTKAGSAIGGGMGGEMAAAMGGSLSSSVVPVAGAAALAGGALLGVGQTFDEMTDIIVTGTGASGEALEALRQDAMDIATAVPVPFEQAGDIVQDLNTRMGLTGDDLVAVGERVAGVGKLLGTSVNMDALTGSMNAWGVAGDEVAGKMDYLFNVSQETGIEYNALSGVLEKNAASLKGLGFTFEESANMAGLLDKAGIDASGTMGKMGKALVELAEPGQSASEAFQSTLDQIQGYLDAGQQAEAIDLASKLFGTRGAAQFVGAVQSGALAMDQLRDSSLGAGEGILGTYDATADFPEKLEQLQNKILTLLEPLGSGVLDLVNWLVDGISAGLDAMSPFLGSVVDLFSALWEVVGPVASLLGDVLGAVVLPTLTFAFEVLAGPIQLVADVLHALGDVFESVFQGIRDAWNSTVGGFGFSLPDWIPGLGGARFEIPRLASGGVATEPTFAQIGEGTYDEAVLPLSQDVFHRLAVGIRDAGASGPGGQAPTVCVYVTVEARTDDPYEMGRMVGDATAYKLRMMGVTA